MENYRYDINWTWRKWERQLPKNDEKDYFKQNEQLFYGPLHGSRAMHRGYLKRKGIEKYAIL